ncbi:MAG: HD domain-containing protein, partial [Victivallales bacterium]|nr:HD domain-containing protein [Victivallales bacterium]MCF7888478.1 HD domain-containing protein [Victivallales bacterium]
MDIKKILFKLDIDTGILLDSVLNHIDELVFIVSKDYMIIWANEAFEKLYSCGYGRYCYEITHNLNAPCSCHKNSCPLEDSTRTVQPSKTVHIHYDKKNNPLYVQVSALPLKNKNGQVNYFLHFSKNITLKKELEEVNKHSIKMLAIASEFRDTDTGLHISRLKQLSESIALELGMDFKKAEKIGRDSQLHDLGKIAISDSILQKPGKLTNDEFEIMKKHTVLGSEIIGNSKWFIQSADIALFHHERWDGKGYPNGLKGKDIPLAARIVSIADVFDALISKRPYKKAWKPERAVEEIKRNSGTQFDPAVVDAFLSLYHKNKLNL